MVSYYGRGKRWRVRYRDPGQRLRAESYKRKTNAERRRDELSAEILTGRFVDPDAGKVTFKEYAERWRTLQVHRGNTEDQIDVVLEIRTYPRLGHLPLASIDSEDIQSWVKWLSTAGIALAGGKSKGYAPATVGVTHRIVSDIFKSVQVRRRHQPDHVEPMRGHAPTEEDAQARQADPDRVAVDAHRCFPGAIPGPHPVHRVHRTSTG
jgi:hypothetical protein